jgi:hypothetical protein
MLDEAIRKQEREAGRADDGAVPADEQGDGTPSEEGEPGAAPGAPPYGEPVPPGSGGPRPEDFDATRPVEGSGIRYLGPGKGPEYPETPPPESDFPKPAARTTTLGYDKDVWKPTSGFKSPATWSKPLPPATSFGNGLSGWGKPVTSFGPRWWAPTPASWPTSLGNGAWTPSDGFAKDQQRRNEMFEKKPESGEEKPADAGQGE